ncbi:MAG: hypothetical protein AAF297_09095 [Planctomycetota bacterium]
MTTVPSAATSTNASLDPTGGNWDWQPQPDAQKLIDELLITFTSRCPDALRLAERMNAQTGTRFKDWVSLILTQDTPRARERLAANGFEPIANEFYNDDIHFAFECRKGLFPRILLTEADRMSVGIKAESVADFFAAMQIPGIERIEGEPLSRARWAKVFDGDRAALWVCERHGYDQFGLTDDLPEDRIAAQHFLERFRARPRSYDNPAEGFAELGRLVEAAIDEIGRDWACSLFFQAEREYWMGRNTAARVQFARQQRLGLGWANHDHHTYRNSREHYTKVIEVFEKLGFHCRERFYAGGEAGWGAQVLEQPTTGIVIFADVDMTADEVKGDFAHDGFGPKDDLGTIGLWCHLHGESLLDAGMHHLECQFDHAALVDQLESEAGIKTMDPFTDFPYLRQAFTEGERWIVREDRLSTALDKGFITAEQADAFRTTGALGSHLENLERNDGFKGFNQTGVSDIIGRTDARRNV